MEDIIEVLALVEIFKDLDGQKLGTIAKRCRRDKYHRRQTIFNYDDASADVYFIKTGRVGITMFSEAGKEISFRHLKPGDMFGEIAAIDQLPRSASAVSQSNLELFRLSERDFLEIMHDMPEVGLRVMQRLTFLVRALSERIFEFTTFGVRNRIQAELLRLARASGQGTEIIKPLIYALGTWFDN